MPIKIFNIISPILRFFINFFTPFVQEESSAGQSVSDCCLQKFYIMYILPRNRIKIKLWHIKIYKYLIIIEKKEKIVYNID